MTNLLISFPKSGRTWLRHMLAQLGVPLEYWHADSDHQLALHQAELPLGIAADYDHVLTLLRDPRDAIVSGYHTVKRRREEPYAGDMSEFIRDPRHGIEKAARFNLTWAEWVSQRDDAALVTYEELRSATLPVLTDILRFFEEPRSKLRIRSVIWLNDFSRAQLWDGIRTRIVLRTSDRDAMKARRGEVGSHRDELSTEALEYCNAVLEQMEYFERVDACLAARGIGARTLPRA